MKANGDLIKQWEIQAVLGADRALKALAFNLCRRVAAGARVQGGKYDIFVEAFGLGNRRLDLAELESCLSGPSGDCYGVRIDTAARVAADERLYASARRKREQRAKRGAARRTEKKRGRGNERT
jgi:hypothetical protein